MCLQIPAEKEYYDMCYNEIKINKKIARSEFASNFPKLLKSGARNGREDQLMNIFEYLGKKVPEEKWNKQQVYTVIKSRLEELHLLGITHNDVRLQNIHVSESGKISLIDFGLSDCSYDWRQMKRDFERSDYILGIHRSSENVSQESQ